MRARWRLGLEASLALTVASLAVRLLPDARAARLLGRRLAGDHDAPQSPQAQADALLVGRAVARVADALPWQPVCLPRAIATRAMLRRRAIRATCHLGMVVGLPRSAHAWVTVNDVVVQGGPVPPVTELTRLG